MAAPRHAGRRRGRRKRRRGSALKDLVTLFKTYKREILGVLFLLLVVAVVLAVYRLWPTP